MGYNHLMEYSRFKFIIRFFSISLIPKRGNTNDPFYRLRPLIDMFRESSKTYITLGRNITVEETSIA